MKKHNLFFTFDPTEASQREDMPALQGERLHFTVWKDEFNGFDIEKVGLRWVKLSSDGCTPSTSAVAVGVIEPPRCSDRLTFCLTLNENRTDIDLQFSIQIGFENFFGTFIQPFKNTTQYISDVADWFRKSNKAKQVRVNGNEICVEIERYCGLIDYANKPIEIVLGQPQRTNSNVPTLTKTKIGKTITTAQDKYDLYVGIDVREGNVFRIGSSEYVAKSGDISQTVIDYFAKKNTVIFPKGVVPVVSASAGVTLGFNTNNPNILAVFETTIGTNDHYKIVVGSDVRSGNIYAVNGTNYTSTSGDTRATVEAYFNSNNGYFIVPIGTFVSALAAKGKGALPNGNVPVMKIANKRTEESRQYDEYSIVVGSSVSKGNLFSINAKTVEADADDTAQDVAIKLSALMDGTTAEVVNPFVVKVPVSTVLKTLALSSNPYDDTNITRWNLGCKYLIGCSFEQYFVQVVTPCDCGCYYLEAFDLDNQSTILGRTQNISVSNDYAETTSMIWFWESRKTFQFEHQKGFIHRVRVPGVLDNPKQTIEETERLNINGQVKRGLTQIGRKADYATDLRGWSFHDANGAALKHRNLRWDGDDVYVRGEYKVTDRMTNTTQYQATAEVLGLEARMWNYDVNCLHCGSDVPKIKVQDNYWGVSVEVVKNCQKIELIGIESDVPTGSFELWIDNPVYSNVIDVEVTIDGVVTIYHIDRLETEKINIGHCHSGSVFVKIKEPKIIC